MLRKRLFGTERRFIGNGNTWVGDDQKMRGWKLSCSSCPQFKVIASHNPNGNLPPPIILKKFEQAGWFVGASAEDDLCATCYPKYVAAVKKQNQRTNVIPIKPTVVVEAAPIEEPPAVDPRDRELDDLWHQAFELEQRNEDLLKELTDAKAQIVNLNAHIEHLNRLLKARSARSQNPVADKRDDDFQKWLDEQQTIHEQQHRKIDP